MTVKKPTTRFLFEPLDTATAMSHEAFKSQRIPSHVLRNNSVAFCDKHDKYGVCHKCNAEKKAK